MLNDYIVSFCGNELIALDRTCGCAACSHPSGNCSGDCSICLDQVHWGPKEGERIDYTCYKLLCNYVCKFAYRYMENILKLLRLCNLDSFGAIDVFSIGCGATPDLMAFERTESIKTINYLGIDRNKLWEPIHKKIEEYCGLQHNTTIDLKRIDVFDTFDCIDYYSYSPNLVVIQYLISHLYNTAQQERICELYRLIVRLVNNNKRNGHPTLIIINDVDSYLKGRNLFCRLLNILEDEGIYGKAFAISNYANGDLGKIRWGGNRMRKGRIDYEYRASSDMSIEGAALIIEVQK